MFFRIAPNHVQKLTPKRAPAKRIQNQFDQLSPPLRTTMTCTILILSLFTHHVYGITEGIIQNRGMMACKRATDVRYNSFEMFVATSEVIVDKSTLLHAVIAECKHHSVIVLAYPPKWGKTYNLKMFKSFLEIKVNTTGDKIPYNYTISHQLFSTGQVVLKEMTMTFLRKPLAISYHTEFFHEFHGKYPTIYADFYDMLANNHTQFIAYMRIFLGNLYNMHSYLANSRSSNISEEDKHRFFKFQNQTETDPNNLALGIRFLSELLYKYYGDLVFVLVDAYDVPLNRTFLEVNYTGRYETFEFYVTMFRNTFVDNPYIEKGVICGVLRLHQLNLTDSFDFAEEFSSTQYRFIEYFGFNQIEASALMDHHAVNVHRRDDVKNWYNGYRLGASSKMRIYNPWSLMNFVDNHHLLHYWTETDYVGSMLKAVLQLQTFENALTILLSESIYFVHLLGFKYGIPHLAYFMQYDAHSAITVALEYLYSTGYLTMNGTFTGEACISMTPLQIPNMEVFESLKKIILKHFFSKLHIPTSMNYLQELQRLADNLQHCIEQTNSTCEPLQNALQLFLGKIKRTEHLDDDVIRSYFNFMFVYTDVFRFMGFNDLMIAHHDQGVGIALKYNSTMTEEELQNWQNIFQVCFQQVNRKKMKIIAINVMPDVKVAIVNRMFKC